MLDKPRILTIYPTHLISSKNTSLYIHIHTALWNTTKTNVFVTSTMSTVNCILKQITSLYREYYMIAHTLLNLLNELLAEHFYLFFFEINKFNNTRAQMLDFIYHMSLKSHFWNECGHDFAIFYATL